jgi:BirA family biotin operon repressor/biotin-[acetyl-CoA-carboxylase] ligase
MFDPLPADLDAALEAARARLAGYAALRYVNETDSTNDLALMLAAAGAPEGTSVLAGAQRRGRGRRGREWFSPPGTGLYLSMIVRPDEPDRATPLMTLAAGVAAVLGVRAATALQLELKWPNDLVIGRPWRKLGGILCETSGTGSRVDAIVVGIGINLATAAYPREIAHRATAIETELGRPIERASVVVALLAAVHDMTSRLRAHGDEAIRNEWREFAKAGLSGAGVRWTDTRGERRGRARGIDLDGALLVDVDGTQERVIAGELVWEGLSRE